MNFKNRYIFKHRLPFSSTHSIPFNYLQNWKESLLYILPTTCWQNSDKRALYHYGFSFAKQLVSYMYLFRTQLVPEIKHIENETVCIQMSLFPWFNDYMEFGNSKCKSLTNCIFIVQVSVPCVQTLGGIVYSFGCRKHQAGHSARDSLRSFPTHPVA